MGLTTVRVPVKVKKGVKLPKRVPPVLLKGRYTCRDSDPGTWASNDASGRRGFCTVQVVPAIKNANAG